jgi:hypothetical protein
MKNRVPFPNLEPFVWAILIALFTGACLVNAAPTANSRTYKDTYDSYHITAAGTTIVDTVTIYPSMIQVTINNSGTNGSLIIRDKGNPQVNFYRRDSLQVGTFNALESCTGGIAKNGLEIVVGGANPAPSIDIVITYSQ